MFGLDLTHALFALRPRVAARGGVGVFGIEQQIAPQTPQPLERRRPFRLLERGQRGQLLDRQRAAFGLSIESCVLRVGADAVFPIGSKVAADGLELVSELLLDHLEIVAESRQLQARPGVFGIPAADERPLAGDQIGVFQLASEHQNSVGPVPWRFEGLQKRGQAVAAAGLARRQAAYEPQVRVLACVRHQHLCAVGALPPEWRTGLPPSVEGLRASVVVGARGEVLDAGGA